MQGAVLTEHLYRGGVHLAGLARHGDIGGGKHVADVGEHDEPGGDPATGQLAPLAAIEPGPDVTGGGSLLFFCTLLAYSAALTWYWAMPITATCSLTVWRAVKPMRPSKSP